MWTSRGLIFFEIVFFGRGRGRTQVSVQLIGKCTERGFTYVVYVSEIERNWISKNNDEKNPFRIFSGWQQTRFEPENEVL